MYKSRQKIIGVSITSVVVLGAFGVATWAIINASNNIPKADAQKAYYAGKTSYLVETGGLAFDTDTMSVYDWINANYPTKLLYEKKATNSYSIYYYTYPDADRLNLNKDAAGNAVAFNWNNYNDASSLLALNKKESSPLICRVDVTETSNSYSYSVHINNPIDLDDVQLSQTNINFTDDTKTNIASISGNSINGGSYNTTSSNNQLSLNDNSIKYTGNATTQGAYSMNLDVIANSTGSNSFSWLLTKNSDTAFTVTNSGMYNGNTRESVVTNYSYQTNTGNDENTYKVFNLTHSVNGTTLSNRANYLAYWKTNDPNAIPKLHLEDEIGMIGFIPNIFK